MSPQDLQEAYRLDRLPPDPQRGRCWGTPAIAGHSRRSTPTLMPACSPRPSRG